MPCGGLLYMGTVNIQFTIIFHLAIQIIIRSSPLIIAEFSLESIQRIQPVNIIYNTNMFHHYIEME